MNPALTTEFLPTIAPTWTLTIWGRQGNHAVRHFSGDSAERRARLAFADAMVDHWHVAARLESSDPTENIQAWQRPGFIVPAGEGGKP